MCHSIILYAVSAFSRACRLVPFVSPEVHHA